MYTCQSGSVIFWSDVNGYLKMRNHRCSFFKSCKFMYVSNCTYCSTLQASSISIARLRFLPLVSANLTANSSGKVKPSRLQIECRILFMSEIDGAGTLIPKHRDLIAGRTRDVEFAQSISLHVATYFSIVRRRACCASLVSWSTLVSSTTDINQYHCEKNVQKCIQ